MSIYDAVRDYHAIHGDDGSERSMAIRYRVVRELIPDGSLLDAGCGTQQFKRFVPDREYTGIDLLDGTNVLDYDVQHDVVVALGMFVRVPSEEQFRLIRHLWTLARKALVVQTLSSWFAWGPQLGDNTPANPSRLLTAGWSLSPRVILRLDYLPQDVTMAVYRGLT